MLEATDVIPQAVAVLNRKGGVLKTTTAAAVATTAGAWGWRVLLIELDDQGTLGLDVGYLQAGGTDRGERLRAALLDGQALEPERDVKEGVDFVPAGRALESVERSLDEDGGALDAALTPLTGEYDLIVLDCPPRGMLLTEALLAARWLLIPARPEEGSIHGLEPLARLTGSIRSGGNPWLEPAGVLLVDVKRQATRQLRRIRTALQELLGDTVPVLDPTIRHAPATADRLRTEGTSVGEAATERRAQIKQRRWRGSWPANVEDLAQDWAEVTRIVLERVTESINEAVDRSNP